MQNFNYGKLEIGITCNKEFFVKSEKGTRILRISDTEPTLAIEEYGFSLDYFTYIKPNQFGLKEVASFNDEKLVVSSNGLFIQYSGGLPSLVGLPSEHTLVSGVYVNEDNKLVVPQVTLFSSAQNNLNSLLCMMMSFRSFPVQALSLTNWIDTLGSEFKFNGSLTSYQEEMNFSSKFAHLYPRLEGKAKDLYQSYMDSLIIRKLITGEEENVPPLVLDI